MAGAAGEAEGAENRYGPQPQPLTVEGGQREAPARYETIFKYHLLLCVYVYIQVMLLAGYTPACMLLFAWHCLLAQGEAAACLVPSLLA